MPRRSGLEAGQLRKKNAIIIVVNSIPERIGQISRNEVILWASGTILGVTAVILLILGNSTESVVGICLALIAALLFFWLGVLQRRALRGKKRQAN